MKISKKQAPLVFSVLMALSMSLVMSFFMLLIKAGIRPGFLQMLLKDWALGFVVALLPSFLLPKLINRLMRKFIKEEAKG